jgi:hypothetical protein
MALLQPVNPFNHRRRGEADSAAELGKGNARVGLEFSQNFAIDIVNGRMNQASQ